VSDFERRRVLVIGGFGFIGVNLTERLRGLGARVTIATRSVVRHAPPPPTPSREAAASSKPTFATRWR
jgi:nucleoside-diphosphate-sugar epimerase